MTNRFVLLDAIIDCVKHNAHDYQALADLYKAEMRRQSLLLTAEEAEIVLIEGRHYLIRRIDPLDIIAEDIANNPSFEARI